MKLLQLSRLNQPCANTLMAHAIMMHNYLCKPRTIHKKDKSIFFTRLHAKYETSADY